MKTYLWVLLLAVVLLGANKALGAGAPVVIDTVIGQEFSDAFALVQAARTPGLALVGVTTAFYDTEEEARSSLKLLDLVGRPDVPVAVGRPGAPNASPLADWSRGYAARSASPQSATELILDLSKKYAGDLRIIVTGPLTNLAGALKADPALAGRLDQVYIPDVRLDGQVDERLALDLESAQTVFAASIPLTLFDREISSGIVLTRKRILQISESHSPVSGVLLSLAALFAEREESSGQPLCLSSCFPVAFANMPATSEATPKRYQFVRGALFETDQEPCRKVEVVIQTHPSVVVREVIDRIDDANQDFSTTLAQFLLGLGKFSKDSAAKVAEKTAAGLPLPPPPTKLSGADLFRFNLLAYIGHYLDMLKDLPDPAAQESFEHFKETYTRVAKLGWWFPPDFYEAWTFEAIPGQPVALRLGIANPAKVPLTQVRVSFRAGEETGAKTIESASEDVLFDFALPAVTATAELPTAADIRAEFVCRGIQFNLADRVPIRMASSLEATAIRPSSCALEVRLEAKDTGANAMPPLHLTAWTGAGGESGAAKEVLPSITRETWTSLKPVRAATTEYEQVHLSLDREGPPTAIHRRLEALMPPADSTILIEPVGPSTSACEAVERKGKLGWSTDILKGDDSVEFRVLPHTFPQEASPPLRVTVQYFSDGDDFDSYRIEAATQSAVYQPVTGWMMKPEHREWRADRLRLSPKTEAMFRSGAVRWLRVVAGPDGDEIVRWVSVAAE
jgi:hypothetical protein